MEVQHEPTPSMTSPPQLHKHSNTAEDSEYSMHTTSTPSIQFKATMVRPQSPIDRQDSMEQAAILNNTIGTLYKKMHELQVVLSSVDPVASSAKFQAISTSIRECAETLASLHQLEKI